MSTAMLPSTSGMTPAALEKVLLDGDLSSLSPADRVAYYRAVCESVGLNPLTKPFDYLRLSGKLTLYCRKDATDQIRRNNGVSVTITARDRHEDVYVVMARATTPDGRSDEAIGAVPIAGLKGELLANAMMKAETKAKRRATLSLVGLGWLDESERDSIPGAQAVRVDMETGEILDARSEPAEAPRSPQGASPSSGRTRGQGSAQRPPAEPQGAPAGSAQADPPDVPWSPDYVPPPAPDAPASADEIKAVEDLLLAANRYTDEQMKGALKRVKTHADAKRAIASLCAVVTDEEAKRGILSTLTLPDIAEAAVYQGQASAGS